MSNAAMAINPIRTGNRSLPVIGDARARLRDDGPTWIVLLELRRIRVCERRGTGASAQLLPVPGLDLALPPEAAEPAKWVRERLMVLMGRLIGVCLEGGRFGRLVVKGDGDGPEMFRRCVDAATRLSIADDDELPEMSDLHTLSGFGLPSSREFEA